MLVMGVTPEQAPDEDEYVTMTFEKGVPTSVNGVKMKVSDIIRKLNELGGKHGIGIVAVSYTHLDVYKRQVVSCTA